MARPTFACILAASNVRRHHVQSIPSIYLLVSSLSLCSMVVGTVLISRVLADMIMPASAYSNFASASVFVGIVSLGLLRPRPRMNLANVGTIFRQCLLGVVAFIVMTTALGQGSMMWRPEGMLIGYLATCEELVYRFLLPLQLCRALRKSESVSPQAAMVSAQGMAQLTFALSHFVGQAPSAWTAFISQAAWFTLGGLVFSVLTVRFGLRSAVGVHAIFNLELRIADYPALFLPSLPVLLGLILLLLVLLVRVPSTTLFGLYARVFDSPFSPGRASHA